MFYLRGYIFTFFTFLIGVREMIRQIREESCVHVEYMYMDVDMGYNVPSLLHMRHFTKSNLHRHQPSAYQHGHKE